MAEEGETMQYHYQRKGKALMEDKNKEQSNEALREDMRSFKAEIKEQVELMAQRSKALEEKLTAVEDLLKSYFSGPPLEVTKRGQDQGSHAKGNLQQEEEQGIHDTEVVESNTILSSKAPRPKRRAEGESQPGEEDYGTRRRIGSQDHHTSSRDPMARQDHSTSYPTEDITPTDVMGVRMTTQGNKEVLIKWKGWPWNCCTWEPAGWLSRRYPEFHLEDKVEFWEAGIDRYRQPSPHPWNPHTEIRAYAQNLRQREAQPKRHRPNPHLQQYVQTPTHHNYDDWGQAWVRPLELQRKTGPTRGARIRAAQWGDNRGRAFRKERRLGDIQIKQEPMETYDGGGDKGRWMWE